MPVTTRRMARSASSASNAQQQLTTDPLAAHVKVMDNALVLLRHLDNTGKANEQERCLFAQYMEALQGFQNIPGMEKYFLMHSIINSELLKWMQRIDL